MDAPQAISPKPRAYLRDSAASASNVAPSVLPIAAQVWPEVRPTRRSKISTVLLATDLTGVSDNATSQAIDLASAVDARLLIVNVIDPARREAQGGGRIDQVRAEREPMLLGAVEHARFWGVEATYLLWTGEPGRSIVSAAEAEMVDIIVVGTRGLAKAGRWLLGSVSDHVVHHAACPVLVVR